MPPLQTIDTIHQVKNPPRLSQPGRSTPGTAQAFPSPLRVNRREDILFLRGVLTDAGYNESLLDQMVRSSSVQDGNMDVGIALRITEDPTPANTLFRLLFLGRPVSMAEAETAFSPQGLKRVAATGLVKPTKSGLRSQAMLTTFYGHWVLGDFSKSLLPRKLRADHVVGPNPSTRELAAMTVRRKIDRALDLCCGSGAHAFTLAGQAGQVVGADISDRALNFAEFARVLNGFENIDLRLGGLYEPVEGEAFDLIVANPPFVISPQSQYTYRDSGMGSDSISQRVIRGAPGCLRDGGYAVVLFNWHHKSEDDWTERLAEWLKDSDCHTWVVRFSNHDPVAYAANWIRQTEDMQPHRYRQMLDQWVGYYAQHGIGRISGGAVFMKKSSGTQSWTRFETVTGRSSQGGCGEHIERVIAAEELLQDLGDDDRLLDMTFSMDSNHSLEQSLTLEGDRWVVQSQTIKRTAGFSHSAGIDAHIANLVARCDGQRPLRQAIADLAGRVGQPFDQVKQDCINAVKTLLRYGLLYPTRAVS